MLNTIEQKLSAIKAINESKDSVERMLTSLQDLDLNPDQQLQIMWVKEIIPRSVSVLDSVKKEVITIVKNALLQERDNLIMKASELMK
jgi:hypothetical protein